MSDPGIALHLKQSHPIPLDTKLDCAPGEMLALVGPSGSGKTTILRTIAGLYRPAHAQVVVQGLTWNDARICLPAHQRRVGMVFQNYALFPHMTALDNVVAALDHLPQTQRQHIARDWLDRMHLAGLEERFPAELSGGQQQRVAIARALAREPHILLLDEPFSAVDRATRQSLYDDLAGLRRNLDIPVIVVTHDFDEAARLAQRLCLLDRGRIIQTGSPREVLARPVSPRAAALLDIRNIFEAEIVEQTEIATIVRWGDRLLACAPNGTLGAGERVSWSIPGTHVLLSRTDIHQPDELPNRFAGEVTEVLHLSESVSARVRLKGEARSDLSLTLPAHYARRTHLAVGSSVTVLLVAEAINLMSGSD